MNKGDEVWKCPICDRLISNLGYVINGGSNICPRCKTSIIYYELFKIDKDDKIKTSINIESDIEAIIKRIFEEEILKEEFSKIYLDGYSRGFKEGVDEGYSEGYNDVRRCCYGVRS